ncbi:glycosyltransferase family 8 protein [Nonomuraea sp. NPDC049152]|uniref:glycosyltransferase family 8 protein n=1 Tax=Nonomuraea sp. NPDC049152 TaxID=3154350 RepID=UPI0033CE85AB
MTGGQLPPIVCGVDERYARPLCVLMESLAAAHGPDAGLRLIVLHHDLGEQASLAIDRNAARLGLAAELRQVRQAAGGYPVSGWVSDAVYLRLAIGDVIDEPVVLYLDADTLVMRDLRPLLHRQLGGAAVAAVRDPQNPVIGSGIALPGWQSLNIPAGREYFNSGVMLLDLAECRRQRVFERSHQFLVDHPDMVTLWDQDALNWALEDQWVRLERRWNTFALSPLVDRGGYYHADAEPFMPLARLLADEPSAAVLHFAGPDKPWNVTYHEGPLRDIYLRLLARVNAEAADEG